MDRPLPAARRFDLVRRERGLAWIADPAGYASGPLALPPVLVEAARLLDGRRTVRDVQRALHERRAVLVPADVLARLAARLDEAGYLDTPALRARAAALDRAFLAAPTRPAAAAGQLYPANAAAIAAYADGLAEGPPGPVGPQAPPVAAVLPHIDWFRGREVYRAGYAALRALLPEGGRAIVLGTSHVPLGAPAALTTKAFETPLGPVAVDRAAAERLLDAAGGWLRDAEPRHRWEHSIETTAVWLRAAWRAADAWTLLPLLVDGARLALGRGGDPRDDPRMLALLDGLRAVVADRRRPTVVIAAADLAHLGALYGDAPCGPAAAEAARAADLRLLDAALAGRADDVLAEVRRERGRRRVCGLSALWTLAALEPRAPGGVLAWQAWQGQGSLVSFAAGLAALG